MSVHIVQIGQRLEDEISRLESVAREGLTDNLSENLLKMNVSLLKRRRGIGRDTGTMPVEEGVTIIPLGPKNAGGTNDREDVAYRFMVSIAAGTRSDQLNSGWIIGAWEQAIRRRLHNRRLGDRNSIDDLIPYQTDEFCELSTVVRTGELPDWVKLEDGIDSTVLEISVYVREGRLSV